MAVVENDVLMKYKDSSGNVNFLYPITHKNNVDGLDEAIRDQSVTTEGDGSVYTATVEGITSLSSGVSFVMVPHVVSVTSSAKLNVNSLGEKFIRRRVSGSTTAVYNAKTSDDWLAAGKPIRVTYDGTQWIADMPVPNAADLMGTVAIKNGGTDATTAVQARVNLGIETSDGTVTSGNADYAEVGEWSDGNTSGEDRIGYFVCVDLDNPGIIMKKATRSDDIRGVTVSAPAFSGGCSADKFDSSGALLPKYDYVAVMGIVPVIDKGTCTVGGRCMPASDSTAAPVSGDYGYQVMERVDDTHVLIAVEPGSDFQYNLYREMLPKSGGYMQGDIQMNGYFIKGMKDPVDLHDAATKTYVDGCITPALLKSGGTMTGDIAMGKNKITGLGTPTDASDAATKDYVDGKLVGKTATIPTSGWYTWKDDGVTFGYVEVTITGMLASDSLIVDYNGGANSSSTVVYRQLEWWNTVYKVSSMDGRIRVYATEVPTEEIPIKLKVVR